MPPHPHLHGHAPAKRQASPSPLPQNVPALHRDTLPFWKSAAVSPIPSPRACRPCTAVRWACSLISTPPRNGAKKHLFLTIGMFLVRVGTYPGRRGGKPPTPYHPSRKRQGKKNGPRIGSRFHRERNTKTYLTAPRRWFDKNQSAESDCYQCNLSQKHVARNGA